MVRPTRAGRLLADVVIVGGATVVAIPSVYLGLVSAIGLPAPRPGARPAAAPSTRFAILVPAHDEEHTITAALESFRGLDYPHDRFEVHVAADNCTDATAEVVVRFGWEAHVRRDPARPGKGPALNWLFERVVDDRFDAVVVVDADTTLDPGFLLAMDRARRAGAAVAQGYYSVREPDAAPATSFRYAALACRHHLRPLGRNRLGASCGLYGNGMMFDRDVLSSRRWSDHLVEDAQLQLELLLDGIPVRYVPDARLWAEMPVDDAGATSQNQRWERGRIELAARFLPRLARRFAGDRSGRIATADAIVDLLVPPVSVIVVAQGAVVTASALGAIGGRRAAGRALVVSAIALAITIAHVVAGLIAVRAPVRHLRALTSAPRILWWKARLWVGVARPGADVPWQRTRRHAEGDRP